MAEFETLWREDENPTSQFFWVKQIPSGDAPEAIRSEWVGVILPIIPRSLDGPMPAVVAEVNSGERVELEDSVTVRRVLAVQALRKFGRVAAAEYWAGRRIGGDLVFDAREGIILRRGDPRLPLDKNYI